MGEAQAENAPRLAHPRELPRAAAAREESEEEESDVWRDLRPSARVEHKGPAPAEREGGQASRQGLGRHGTSQNLPILPVVEAGRRRQQQQRQKQDIYIN